MTLSWLRAPAIAGAPVPGAGATGTLVLSEMFGPTVQGEGPSAGRPAFFIRLGGCNLHCSWCDTPYTWDASRADLRAELRRTPVPDIVAAVREHAATLGVVVITGGEPLLHQRMHGWASLLDALWEVGVPVEVETNGTIEPTPRTRRRVARFNVSPKLAHAGDPVEKRIVPAALLEFTRLARQGKACMKFVVRTPDDVMVVDTIAAGYGLPPSAVWLMPEGVTSGDLIGRPWIAEEAARRGWNVSTRLHVLLWGQERGR